MENESNLQKKTSLAKIVAEEYDFNGYAIDKDVVVKIVNRISEIEQYKKLKDHILTDFLYKLRLGEFGTLAKNPMDIVSKFNFYADKHMGKLAQ